MSFTQASTETFVERFKILLFRECSGQTNVDFWECEKVPSAVELAQQDNIFLDSE